MTDSLREMETSKPTTRLIRCCGCGVKVDARLTDGTESYPHRPDLASLPFWKCDVCGNHVGCHHKTTTPTEPLGNIPTPALRIARQRIHAKLDPLWKSGRYSRKELYDLISERLGFPFHTANLRSLDEVGKVLEFVEGLK